MIDGSSPKELFMPLSRLASKAITCGMQVLPVKGMGLVSRSASSAGDVFVASSSGDAGIMRLTPLPFAQQARALADRNELSAALEMASLVPSSQVRQQEIWLCRACQ